MADPLEVIIPADAWTKIATSVVSGNVHRKSTDPVMYLQTYRLDNLGSPAADPSDKDEGVPLFSESDSEPISSSDPINIWIWADKKAGKVRVDV